MRSLLHFQQTWLFIFLCFLIAIQTGREYRLSVLDWNTTLELFILPFLNFLTRGFP